MEVIGTMDADGIDEFEGFGSDSKAGTMWEVAKGMTFEGVMKWF